MILAQVTGGDMECLKARMDFEFENFDVVISRFICLYCKTFILQHCYNIFTDIYKFPGVLVVNI